ncbi:DNA repair protein RecO [Thermophilibacter mediterraneus]|uniref:DNA repair protein RecO n=1 Tax=Thermophilibacter mediterraneus TaxID=1871031 RepID=UPI0009309B42|nr:DNA repair protein RecO [Thermophilibacter mediterraneus]
MAGRRTYRTRAIVLDRTKLGEADLILTLLGQDGSQLRAVAKGARKPGGRLAARVELFCETDFLLAAGRSLDVVSEASLVEPHAGLRGDYERVAAASAVAEVARLTCFEDAPDPFLRPICSRALGACEEAPDRAHLDLVVAAYAWKVLAHGGWRPELAACCACGDADVAFFSPAAGGALCGSCAREVAGAEALSAGELAWLRATLACTFDELLAAEVDGQTAALLLALSHSWAVTHLDARLRAMEFLAGA